MSPRRRFRLLRTGVCATALIALTVVLVSSHGGGQPSPPARPAASTHPASRPVVGDTGSIQTGNALVRSPLTLFAADCANVVVAHELIVSVSMQRLFACDGAHLAMTTLVTTGSVTQHWQTPLGTWKVYAKQTDRWLSGPGYSDYVHYWMPFFGNYGIHDATWQTFPDGSSLYISQGSHGCVQVPLPAMSWLYAWSPVQTVVHVVS